MEIWQSIQDFEDYKISSFWNIKSFKNWKEKFLKPWSKHHDYQCIYLCSNKKRNVKMIHRLVAAAFLGLNLKNSKIQVWHKDNNPKNNKVENLYLTTHKENEEYKQLCNRTTFWEKSGSAKLKEKDVLNIYKLYKEGKTITEIQKIYNHKGIFDIIKGRNWKYLYFNFLKNDN